MPGHLQFGPCLEFIIALEQGKSVMVVIRGILRILTDERSEHMNGCWSDILP